MSRPRFLFVHGRTAGGIAVPGWPSNDAPVPAVPLVDGEWTSWRLMAANNHELARGAALYRSDADCLAALLAGRATLTGGVSLVIAHAGTWWWQLEFGGVPFAVSSRGYRRQRECRYSLSQCLAELGSAELPVGGAEPPASRRGQRRLSGRDPDARRLREAMP